MRENTLNKLAERLKELRLERGLSQRQLAKETNISQSAINKWETNSRNMTVDFAIILAEYFYVSVGYLVGTED